MTADAGLVLGAFDLIDNDGGTYKVETLGEGTDFGNPVPIEVVIRSLLQDGSVVVHEGDDNRTIPLRVVITAPDAPALDEGTAALRAELYRRNQLVYTPPRAYGKVRVFEVVTSSLERIYDDFLEVKLGERHFSVRLVCSPFGHAETETVVEALAAATTPTITLVDNGSATTNWTGRVNFATASVAVVSGAVGITTLAVTGAQILEDIRTASIDTSTTKYLVVDWRFATAPTSTVGLVVTADGVELERVSEVTLSSGGVRRSAFYVPAASVAVLVLRHTTTAGNETVRSLHIDNINRSDAPPSLGTTRQLLRTIAVNGSARTPGRLTIEHDTDPLGDVLLYVFSHAGSPPLRQFYTSGGTVTADANRVSGATNMLDTVVVFDVPASGVPEGGHLFKARLKGDSGGAVVLTATMSVRVNGVDVGPVQTFSIPLTVTTSFANYDLGRVQPLNADVGNVKSATVHITLVDSNTSGIDVTLDEAWLFSLRYGQLVAAACGTGTASAGGPSKRLFVLPSTVETGRPRVLRGHATDMDDAFYAVSADGSAWEQPELTPPGVSVLSMTSNALNADVSLAYFETAAD